MSQRENPHLVPNSHQLLSATPGASSYHANNAPRPPAPSLSTPLPHINELNDHPRLKHLRYEAKRDAAQAHDQATREKTTRNTRPRRKLKTQRTLTKRQLSNKRSAEICRASQGLYISYLEREILNDEEAQHSLHRQQFLVTECCHNIEQKIRTLQEKLDQQSANSSWLDHHHYAAASNAPQDHFFEFPQISPYDSDIEPSPFQHCPTTVDREVDNSCTFFEPLPQACHGSDFLLPSPLDSTICDHPFQPDDHHAWNPHFKHRSPSTLEDESSPVTVLHTAPDVPLIAFSVPATKARTRTI